MKKGKLKLFKVLSSILVVLAGCLLFASFSPSLDGRVVVVDDGVFPPGLFAKTVGYLPGDTITVTSIGGEATVNVLVIGALDPSEGVAIMLSPEAAQVIGISKNSNTIVKITKRSSQDDAADGSAVIAKQAIPSIANNNSESADVSVQTDILNEDIEETDYDSLSSENDENNDYVNIDDNSDEAAENTEVENETTDLTDNSSVLEEEEEYPLVAVSEEMEEEAAETEETAETEAGAEDFNDNLVEEPYVEEEFDGDSIDSEENLEIDNEEVESEAAEEALLEEELPVENPDGEEIVIPDSFNDLSETEETAADETLSESSEAIDTEAEAAEENLPVENEDGTEIVSPEPFEEDFYNEDFGKPLDIPEECESVEKETLEEEVPASEIFEEQIEPDNFDETDNVEETEETTEEAEVEESVEAEEAEEAGEEILEENAAEETETLVEEAAEEPEEEQCIEEEVQIDEFDQVPVRETEEKPSEETAAEETPEAESTEVAEAPEEEAPAEEAPETEAIEEAVEESKSEESETYEDSEVVSEEYEAIVLVPVEGGNPPVIEAEAETAETSEETAETSVEVSTASEDDDVILLDTGSENEETAPVEMSASVETPEVTESPKALVETPASNLDKYKVDSLKNLESGHYYIQIAVLKEEANIKAIIEKYGKNYPVTLVPLTSGTAYQVLIGPLTVDEYAAVLQRFKAYGFKDAFLRKIK